MQHQLFLIGCGEGAGQREGQLPRFRPTCWLNENQVNRVAVRSDTELLVGQGTPIEYFREPISNVESAGS